MKQTVVALIALAVTLVTGPVCHCSGMVFQPESPASQSSFCCEQTDNNGSDKEPCPHCDGHLHLATFDQTKLNLAGSLILLDLSPPQASEGFIRFLPGPTSELDIHYESPPPGSELLHVVYRVFLI